MLLLLVLYFSRYLKYDLSIFNLFSSTIICTKWILNLVVFHDFVISEVLNLRHLSFENDRENWTLYNVRWLTVPKTVITSTYKRKNETSDWFHSLTKYEFGQKLKKQTSIVLVLNESIIKYLAEYLENNRSFRLLFYWRDIKVFFCLFINLSVLLLSVCQSVCNKNVYDKINRSVKQVWVEGVGISILCFSWAKF